MSKFCTNCGSPLETNSKFCSNCGSKIIQKEIDNEKNDSSPVDYQYNDVESLIERMNSKKRNSKKERTKNKLF